jgi:hypothetical protein
MSSLTTRGYGTALVSLSLVLLCCSPVHLDDVRTLQRQIADQFGTAIPGVHLVNGTQLLIAFEDSTLLGKTSAELEQHSKQVVAFVKRRFTAGPGLRSIVVGYVNVQSEGGRVVRVPKVTFTYSVAPEDTMPR